MPHMRLDGGLATYYERFGDGPPLLVILGLGSEVARYRAFYRELATTHHVIAYDHRGTGRSSRNGPYTIEQLADDARHLCEALEIARVSVMGISMGSRVALELARSHQGLISDLVLVSALCDPIDRESMSIPMRLAYLRQWLPRPGASRPQSFRTYGALHEATIRYDRVHELRALSVPTLICHGRRDRTVPITHAKKLHQAIRMSQLVTFPGGHLFFRANREFFDLVASPSPVRAPKAPDGAAIAN